MNVWNVKPVNIPMNLVLIAFADHGTLDLTGLHLQKSKIKDGAGKVEIHFNSLHRERMESMTSRMPVSTLMSD